jgi:threonine dehydrogenase-like Zn-dependent dehydrogenase
LRIERSEEDISTLGPNQIYVETIVSALSTGTDRGNYEGAENVPGAPLYPRWVGYSNVGRVVEMGKEVTRVKIGDRIFTNRPHASGFVMDQGDLLAKIGDGTSSEAAAFTYLYFLGFNSLRRGRFSPGENIAVVGLGILGLATVELANLFGGKVIAIGNDESRLHKATTVGAQLVCDYREKTLKEKIDQFTRGKGCDVVVLAANPWPAFRVAAEISGKDGRLAVLSLPGRGEPPLDFNPLSMEWFYRKELSIIAVSLTDSDRLHLEDNLVYLLDLMEQKKIAPERMITHRLPYMNMRDAYEGAYARDKSMIGVVFQWD